MAGEVGSNHVIDEGFVKLYAFMDTQVIPFKVRFFSLFRLGFVILYAFMDTGIVLMSARNVDRIMSMSESLTE